MQIINGIVFKKLPVYSL